MVINEILYDDNNLVLNIIVIKNKKKYAVQLKGIYKNAKKIITIGEYVAISNNTRILIEAHIIMFMNVVLINLNEEVIELISMNIYNKLTKIVKQVNDDFYANNKNICKVN